MEFLELQQWRYVLRMIIAGCCGFVIGLERKKPLQRGRGPYSLPGGMCLRVDDAYIKIWLYRY